MECLIIPMVEMFSGHEFDLQIDEPEEIENYNVARAKGVGDKIQVNELCEKEVVILATKSMTEHEAIGEFGNNYYRVYLCVEEDGCVRWYVNPERSDVPVFDVIVRPDTSCECDCCQNLRENA